MGKWVHHPLEELQMVSPLGPHLLLDLTITQSYQVYLVDQDQTVCQEIQAVSV